MFYNCLLSQSVQFCFVCNFLEDRWDSGLGKAIAKMYKIRSEQERKRAKYIRTTEVEGLVLSKKLPLIRLLKKLLLF